MEKENDTSVYHDTYTQLRNDPDLKHLTDKDIRSVVNVYMRVRKIKW